MVGLVGMGSCPSLQDKTINLEVSYATETYASQ